MIRRYQAADLEQIMPLWLTSTTQAHPFISPTYWLETEDLVRERYLPQSQTWVNVIDRRIVGFISVFDQRFVGALFVEESWHGKRAGAALMKQVQRRFSVLSLEVYEQNHRACAFYRNMGFSPVSRTFPQETNAPAMIMQWVKPA